MRSMLFLLPVALLVHATGLAQSVILTDNVHHLRSGDRPEWDEFASRTPNGRRLDLQFQAEATEREATLLIRQDDVKQPWSVECNGSKLGQLFLMEAPVVYALAIPGGVLRNGTNTLSIVPPRENDDILVGDIQLWFRPLKEVLSEASLEIEVAEQGSGAGLPCRITVLDERGALAALHAFPEQRLAVRPGVAYTADGRARLGVRPGTYQVYATRGFEYGLASQKVSVHAGRSEKIRLALAREVPTPGYVSSDTHVHTFTFSRHGDATVEERVITLAGEGIDLPIATDHEYLADYSAPAEKMGVAKYLTPVVGCETTTAKGHFNSFPIQLGSKVPDFRITDWPQLMQSIRATPGVRVVILNHPRNIHTGFQPFAATNFNAVTGENRRGFEFSFDAIEVANSSALQSDWQMNFHDWMALLNYGYRVTAVGSSDGHDVSRYIVGQGRSYVACPDADPGRIDIAKACESFLQGRVLVSLGLLAELVVDQKFRVGDLASGTGAELPVEISILAPSWIEADKVELYANGVKVREEALSPSRAPGLKHKLNWRLPRPKHDVHLIVIASGPGVRESYWAIARPYQPSSPAWKPRVVGATNPVWLDADGDGKFTSARGYAQRLVERYAANPGALLLALEGFDEATAAQVASLWYRRGTKLEEPEIARALKSSGRHVQQGFAAFLSAEAAARRE